MSHVGELSLDDLISEKMEENLSNIQKYRNILISIKNLEQFGFERNKIIQGLFNIEDDIRETYQLAKSTLIVNKELNEQIEEEVERNEELTARNNSMEKILDTMQREIRNITSQLEYYKERDSDNLNYIHKLENRLLKFDRNIGNKDYQYERENINLNLNLNEGEMESGYVIQHKSDYDSANYNYDSKNSHVEEKSLNVGIMNSESNNGFKIASNPGGNDLNNNMNDRITEKKMINAYFDKNNNRVDENKPEDKKNEDVPVREELSRKEMNFIDDRPKHKNTSKANRVVDIIMKLNSSDEFYSIIKKLFGQDIEQRLSSSDVDEELITQIEESIKELDQLKKLETKYQNKLGEKDSVIVPEKFNTEGNQVQHDDYCNHSPSWTETGNVGKERKGLQDNGNKNIQINNKLEYNHDYATNRTDKSSYNLNSYDSDNISIPIKSNYRADYSLNDRDQRSQVRSLLRDTFSSRRFSPPKTYENYEDSHWEICRNKSRPKNNKNNYSYNSKNLYPDLENLNRVIAGKILNSNKNEECNFENSLRNYIKKGVRKSKEGSNGIFKNYTTPHGNFFDASLQKGGKSQINISNKNKSKSKSKSKITKGNYNSNSDLY